MQYEIHHRPEFYLSMNAETARLMQRLSAMHYDGRCKAAGQPGGFVFGWVNWTMGPEPETPVHATTHEMDTAMKILEMPPPLTAEERELLIDLRNTINKAMREAGVWK